jgi:hypothetical protein
MSTYIGFIYTKMNEMLRGITTVNTLTAEGIEEAQSVLGPLLPYAKVLWEALKPLKPLSKSEIRVWRGGRLDLKAMEQLQASEGRVLAFQTFTSFSSEFDRAKVFPYGGLQPGQTKVFYQLDCVGRHRIGGFAVTEMQHEQEILLQPFTALLLEKVGFVSGRPLICLRDIALVKSPIPVTVSPGAGVRFRFEFEGESSDILLPGIPKIADALAPLAEMLGRSDLTVMKGKFKAPLTSLVDPAVVYVVIPS